MLLAFVLAIVLLSIPGSLAAATGEGAGVSRPQERASTAGPPDQPIVFKSRAILVQVPVVVTDKTGSHIHNLTKNDFRLLQNKEAQKIAVFDEITATAGRPISTENSLGRFSNVNTGTDRRYALTLIVLDGINTALLDQSYGRMELIKYLSEDPDNGQPFGLMSMNSSGVKRLVSVTDDRTVLISTLKKLNNEVPVLADFEPDSQPFRDPFNHRSYLEKKSSTEEVAFSLDRAIDQTMHALLSIAWSLSGFPGRKSLIWATGSFPFSLDPISRGPENARLALLYQRVMEALNDAQIAVYPLDVRGLVSRPSDDPITNPNTLGTRSLYELSTEAARRGLLIESTVENLRNFADMTGGRAFYNSNDLASGFRQAIEDSASYYMLGYYLNSHNTTPGWRKLRVDLRNDDWQAHARTGFMLGTATLNPGSLEKADENFALVSPIESTGIPITLWWKPPAASAIKGQRSVEFNMVIPANRVIDESEVTRCDLDFVWQADRNGATVVKDGHALKGKLTAGGLAEIKRDGVTYKNSITLAPGDYQVHFVVRDNLSGRIGSLTAPITVN